MRAVFPAGLARRVGFLLLTLPLGIVYFAVLIGGLASAVGGAFIVGIPLFVGLMFLWRALARFERRLVRAGLGVDIPNPYRTPLSETRLGRLRDRLVDPATWKDLAYLLLMFPLGLVSFVVTVGLFGTAITFLTMVGWGWYAIPGGYDLGILNVDTVWEALLVTPLCIPAWLLFVLAVRGLVSIHAAVARTLLSASPDPEMTARVAALQDSRARIIAAADAERRRLERDLHDGAQQRLVALSMQLGLAKRRLAKGEEVGDLVATADQEARAAIEELRDLARGLHPAVLTDRGLAPALRDVANRSAVPVELGELPEERLPGPVEAAAYFTVSEALTNVAKYAQATSVHVEVTPRDGALAITVADDGIGGAEAGGGSGLRGLADRLGALGGELEVESPPGVGTTLRAWIPIAAVPELAAAEPEEFAAETVSFGRRALQTHAVVYALVMALLVFIWLTTGAGYFWPQWSIVGWGLLLALHGWFAEGRHRGMLATETTQPDR
ncbi:MAG: sensor domain-containing protein [Solirubrobacteraceae bacterium]